MNTRLTLPPTGSRIRAIGTALPADCYTQDEIYQHFLAPHLASNPRAEEIFRATGVSSRHLVIEGSFYDQNPTTQERNERYLSEALPLGRLAIQRCLQAAGLGPQDIDDFIVVSCTGIDTPGLDLRLAGELGMRPDLQRAGILGMGCYAAFPGLRRAHDAVYARPGRRALLLAIEICSLHFQLDDPSMDNVVSAGLFADGAAAVLVEHVGPVEFTGPAGNGSALSGGPRLLDFATRCDYQTFDDMAFHLTDTGFQMRLSAYVPRLLSAQVEEFADELLQRNGLGRADIGFWVVHPGSSRILEYTAERLGLQAQALDSSFGVLCRYGNMSSPTVLFVLEDVQRSRQPQPGDYGMLLAFGPGLTLEGALVRW